MEHSENIEQKNLKKILDRKENKSEYLRGLKSGLPICLGYLAVSFSLGIGAKSAGLTPIGASVASLLLNASAGEYALFSVIAGCGGYIQAALAEFVANMRYILMSCALSAKLDYGKTKLWHRLVIGVAVTDEMFGLGVMQCRPLNPYFYLGMMSAAMPGWCIGTGIGVAVGNIIGARLQSALGVSLYGMFLASIVPPSIKDKKIAAVVILSAALSAAAAYLPMLREISESVRIMILTVAVAAAAALVFPIKEETTDEQ